MPVRRFKKWWLSVGALMIAALFALQGCDSGNPADPIEGAFVDLPAQITTSRWLSADSTYLITGTVEVITPEAVDEATSVHIPAGTVILAASGTNAEFIVRRGAKIYAEGASNAPVVFTSSSERGGRSAGEWRGVTIEGLAPVNNPTASFGGNDEADSSGIFQYVRIEFAGASGAALTLSGVGEATDIDHIQLHRSGGVGMSIQGGVVRPSYILVTSPTGTGAVWSDGWTGSGQFWIVQRETDGSGIAGSNGSNGDFAAPISEPELYNLTLIGSAESGTGDGVRFEAGTLGWVRNSIVMNFGTGYAISGGSSEAAVEDTLAGFSYSILHGNGQLGSSDGTLDVTATLQDTLFYNRTNDPRLADPYSLEPNFRPLANSPALKQDSIYAVPDSLDYVVWTQFYLGAINYSGTWIGSWVTYDPD